jgi:hypothetical protein
MNASLFKTRHAWVVSALVVALVALWVVRLEGALWSAPLPRDLRFVSGWVTLAAMAVLGLYGLRKYAHRGGYSPEFGRRTAYPNLEQATRGLQRLAATNAGARTSERKRLLAEAREVVRSARAHKVLRADFQPGPSGLLELRILPTEPLGKLRFWLPSHLWYGVLAMVGIVLHSGVHTDSILGLALLGVSSAVLLSGIAGAVLWSVGPRWLTAAERDLTIEEASALRETLSKKRAAAEAQLREAGGLEGASVGEDPEALAARALERAGGDPELTGFAALCQQEAKVTAELARLAAVRRRIMGWKLVHLPAVILLAGLVALHLVVIASY